MMPPLAFTWPYAAVFWPACLSAFVPEQRIVWRAGRSPEARGAQDAGSMRIIVVGQGLAMPAAFIIAWTTAAGTLSPGARIVAFWLGLVLLVGGSLVRRQCVRALGDSFTGAVTVRTEQPLIDTGVYRWVRHPSYSAAWVMLTGMAIALGNWWGMLLVATTTAIVYGFRVHVEERALLATLGDPYRAYMARTKRFVPFLF